MPSGSAPRRNRSGLLAPGLAAFRGLAVVAAAGWVLFPAAAFAQGAKSKKSALEPEKKTGKIAEVDKKGKTSTLKIEESDGESFEILVTAKPFSAEEAERIGFINRVFDDQTFEAEVEKYAVDIAQVSASAMALTKYLLYQTDAMSFEQALRTGVDLNAIARMTPDCQTGVKRFLSKQ